MKSAESFFKWAFDTRGKTVIALNNGEEISKEKMFLSFCSHDPAFVSNGPAGLNASIKGIGFLPKDEYLEETLEAYINHIKTFDPEDKTYSKRGLEVLIKYMYGEEARERIDFTKVGSLEMAKKHSYANYKANPSQQNAVILNKAVELFYGTMSSGMEYAYNFAKASQGGGFFENIQVPVMDDIGGKTNDPLYSTPLIRDDMLIEHGADATFYAGGKGGDVDILVFLALYLKIIKDRRVGLDDKLRGLFGIDARTGLLGM